MAIIYNENAKTITLQTNHTTYQIKIGPYGLLAHNYYGPSAQGDLSYILPKVVRNFSPYPHESEYQEDEFAASSDVLPMEYSSEGSGDTRATPFGVRRLNGASGCDLRYVRHEIKGGKYALPGLPAVYVERDIEAETLEITLEDNYIGVQVILQYGVLPRRDVITRAAKIINTGNAPIVLQNAASTELDFMTGNWDLLHFQGCHMRERTPERIPVGPQEVIINSRRGVSSHQKNPFVILADRETNERAGLCIGVSLLYSGSFACNVSQDPYGATRLVMGVQPERFEYLLNPGESFQAPEAAMALSNHGFSELSHLFHRLVNHNIVRGPWKNKPRPVLINNWEATQMNFTGERIVEIARKASELGVEMMVLDDGWFGARDTETAGLGDWVVNEKKLGGTMGQLAEKIRALGMKFGFWIEPEMVNENSDLFRKHPDWAFQLPGQPPALCRHQLVLDFSRPEVVDAIFDQIALVLDDCQADYIKMDMNRPVCEVYSAIEGYQSQGMILYQYVLGVYRFMEKLLQRYPNLLLEGCSGGGGRFDAGMLYYCPQIWCSDNTDAIDRLSIQYGTSFGYPVSTMGAHVSAVPNWGTLRSTPFNTRAVVAMSGTFGYELDLNHISDEEKEQVRQQIRFFKAHRDLLHNGLYYRLTDVVNERMDAAWMMVAPDGSEALVNIVTMDATGNAPNRYIRCMGLDAGALYLDPDSGAAYSGAALMNVGIPLLWVKLDIPGMCLDVPPGEYQAFQIHLVRK